MQFQFKAMYIYDTLQTYVIQPIYARLNVYAPGQYVFKFIVHIWYQINGKF